MQTAKGHMLGADTPTPKRMEKPGVLSLLIEASPPTTESLHRHGCALSISEDGLRAGMTAADT